MKPASKLLFFGIFIFIVAASQTQGKTDTTLIRTDSVIQKYDSALNAINQVKQSIPAIVEKQKATLVKISYFNYWMQRLLAHVRSERKQSESVSVDAYVDAKDNITAIEKPPVIYEGTPPREQTEREKQDGKAFRGISNFFRNLFKRNE